MVGVQCRRAVHRSIFTEVTLGFLPLHRSFPISIRGECRRGRRGSQTNAETEKNGAERSAENDAGCEKGAGYGNDAESVPIDACCRFEAIEEENDAGSVFASFQRALANRDRTGSNSRAEKRRR